jgi:hypothetical protein
MPINPSLFVSLILTALILTIAVHHRCTVLLWIGVSKHGAERRRIFSCQLEPVATAGRRPDDVKYGHECLFSRNAGEAHIGTTLGRVGRRTTHILVESVGIDYVKCEEEDYMFHQGRPYFRYMYRVTKFSLEYDENGDFNYWSQRTGSLLLCPERSSSY